MSANIDRLNHCIGRWNAGDLDGYLTLYDSQIRLHGYAPAPMNKAEVTAFYTQVAASLGAPGRKTPELLVHDSFAAGDRVACHFTMKGVHSGPFMGVPASGKAYAIDGITILRFSGGNCVERWSQADLLGLMVQIGAVPMPAN